MIETARDDLQPLARAISVDQAHAAAEKATETLLADLLYWAARSLDAPSDDTVRAELRQVIDRAGVSRQSSREGVAFWVDTYATRRTSHDGSHGNRPVGGGVTR